MLDLLPPAMRPAIAPFVPFFSRRVWWHAQVLLAGAILAPGIRTVEAIPRAMGLGQCWLFERCYRVLNRAVLQSGVSRVLLGLLEGSITGPTDSASIASCS